MTIAAGTNINQYKIISCLGAGGMGEVYLAQDVKLGRKVALKLLYADVKQGEDWVRRFEQEARATSSLNHPNIITIYEVGQADGSHFISTEFIDGRTLREHLKQHTITLREALDIAIQVATALASAHEAGIVHRDIKPENVMLRSDGYVKVVDFGLAKFIEERLLGFSVSDPEADTQAFVKTNPGTVMGTISYMSPEQARGTHVDARSDIFSLGILLYEMLTGRQPFEGTSASEVVISIIQKRPLPMARFSPDLPLEMERIVSKALSKDREERYQTIKDMLIDLKKLKRALELEAETDDVPEQELIRKLLGISGGQTRSNQTDGSGVRVSSAPQSAVTMGTAISPLIPTTTTSSAEYLVKGIKQHKKLVLLVLGALIAAAAAVYYYRATRPIDSIAVLLVDSSNAKPGAEQFGDDITEQLIYRLSKLSPGLRVVPFHEVLRFKGRSAQEVGRELDVRAVLLGRVAMSGEMMTISTELVDIRDNKVLWGDRATTKFSDLTLAVQNIVASVSDKIGLQLSAAGEKKKEADALYMKGRNAWNKRTTDEIKEALVYFNQALNLDPNNAPAYAGLADSYNMLATYGANAPAEAFPKARDAATRALAIDGNLAEAHAALAYAKFRGDWNWEAAEQEFKEAIRLNPNYPSARQWYASYLAAMGRFDEALDETRQTQALDKTSLSINSHFGLMYFFNERFDDAIASCQKIIALDPKFFLARRYLGLAYAQKGMYKEAVAEYEKAMDGFKGSPLMKAEYASVLALKGETNKAQAELNTLLEMIDNRERYISAYHIAAIYVALQERDRAFKWLEQALTERADYMVFLKVDPRFKSLRSDERFKDLLRQMKL